MHRVEDILEQDKLVAGMVVLDNREPDTLEAGMHPFHILLVNSKFYDVQFHNFLRTVRAHGRLWNH